MLYEHFLDPGNLAIVRIVIARSIEDSDFARKFYESKTAPTRRALRELFESWQKAGIGLKGSPETLAGTFLGLLVTDFQTEAIRHGAAPPHTAAQIAERTEFFFRGAGLAD